VGGGTLWYYASDLPDLSDLRENYRPPQITRVETTDGAPVGEIFEERRRVVPFDSIPRVVINALLAAEDADFYDHEGLDYAGILRAMLVNLRQGRMAQGASTITQQVVQTFYIGREKSLARKIREALLARRLEQHLSKDEILFLYLNQINFGHERYGVQEASRFYFGCDVSEVTLAQAALLAGLPRGPTLYSPRRNPDRATARRNWVLGQMAAKGFAEEEAVDQARSSPLDLGPLPPAPDLAPEVISQVRQRLADIVGEDNAKLGGYLVRTTIDSRWQKAARQAVQEGLEAIDQRHNYRAPLRARRGTPHQGRWPRGRTVVGRVVEGNDEAGTVTFQAGDQLGLVRLADEGRYNPRNFPPSQFAHEGALARVRMVRPGRGDEPARLRLEVGPQAALIAIDPESGAVRALVGGYELRLGDFDRATQARRQPGSSFKPFVYSLALVSRQMTPATLIADAPEVFERWRPRNFEEWNYEGHVRLRVGLAKSINMVAIKLIRDLGAEQVVEYAQRLGIESPLDPTPSLALGASAVAPIEMAEAYSVFASGGIHREPRFIDSIEGPDGREVVLPSVEAEQVLEPAEAYLTASLLRSVVAQGTGGRARQLGADVGGKTGTSNDARDAWFVGFMPGAVCAVWVGFDDPRTLGRRESGSRAALPIWVSFMGAARRGRAAEAPPEPPEGIVGAQIDPETGLLAYEGQENAIFEQFLDGTVPTEQAIPPDAADPDTFLMEQTGGATP
jgi:penicillin-binding protein 1A